VKEQYGSCKQHRDDAKACYNLIGYTPASLCMQRQGVPKPAVQCLFTTLQNAIQCIRTAYGDSDISYGGSGWTKPMHGIGQGNGGGPPIWAIISSTLLNILRSKGYGLTMITPIMRQLLSFVGYSFVDDTDIIQSNGSLTTTTVWKLQGAVDIWKAV
jgi:hypothetical protein